MKKNPFITKTALIASKNKRMSRTTPEKDISKVKLATDAIRILKKVKANFRRASAIDAVRKTRKTYHLGGLKTTANFMNKLADLPPNEINKIKQMVKGNKAYKNKNKPDKKQNDQLKNKDKDTKNKVNKSVTKDNKAKSKDDKNTSTNTNDKAKDNKDSKDNQGPTLQI